MINGGWLRHSLRPQNYKRSSLGIKLAQARTESRRQKAVKTFEELDRLLPLYFRRTAFYLLLCAFCSQAARCFCLRLKQI